MSIVPITLFATVGRISLDGDAQVRLPKGVFAVEPTDRKYNYKLLIFQVHPNTCPPEFSARNIVMSANINSIQDVDYLKSELQIRWTVPGPEQMVLYATFQSPDDFATASKTIQKAVWEYLNEEDFDKSCEYVQKVLDKQFEVKERPVPEEEQEGMEFDSEEDTVGEGGLKRTPFASSDEKKKSLTSSALSTSSTPSTSKIRHLTMNKDNTRFFASRGNEVTYYTSDNNFAGNILRTIESIPIVEEFAPSSMLLTNNDINMILLNDNKKNVAYQMDLTQGKIVQEIGTGSEASIRDISYSNKYQQTGTDESFVAVTRNSIFQADPRQKNALVQKKVYAKESFNCITTDKNGYIVTGDAKGCIRLYDKIGTKAKTKFEGWGDPIIGLDITSDGNYVLATTKSYLIVYPTFYTYEDGTMKNGFKGMNKTDRPLPIRLTMTSLDIIKYDLNNKPFTHAHFNMGVSSTEKWIITSRGNYMITWNFDHIKKFGQSEYSVKCYDQEIVLDHFLFGQEDKMAVAFPDSIILEQGRIKRR